MGMDMDVVWGVVEAGRVGASGGVRMGVVGRLVGKGRAVRDLGEGGAGEGCWGGWWWLIGSLCVDGWEVSGWLVGFGVGGLEGRWCLMSDSYGLLTDIDLFVVTSCLSCISASLLTHSP